MAAKDLYVSRPISVITPVVSSLAAVVKRYVESLFPRGYFKDYWVNTELPRLPGEGVRQRRQRLRRMTLSNVERREYPLLSVRVEPQADSSEFSNGDSWYRGNRFMLDPLRLTRFLYDDESFRYGGVETSRFVCNFTVAIVVQTDVQAYDAQAYLRRVAPIGLRSFLNGVTIASEIPADILATIWNDMDLGDPKDPAKMERFTRYLAASSYGFVERTVNTSTGRSSFSWHYETNPILNISSPASVSIERSGNVVRRAIVEVPLSLDVPVPIAFGYRQEELRPLDPATLDQLIISFDGKLGTYMGMAIRARPPARLDEVLSLAYFTGFVSGSELGDTDVTDFSESIPPETREYVSYLRGLGGAPEQLVRPMLWRDAEPVAGGWSFDFSNWRLTISNPALFHNYKYHFGLYADLGKHAGRSGQGRLAAPSPYELP